MKILAIETSTRNLSIVISDERSVLAEYKGDAVLRHSQDLIPNIEELLKKIDSDLIDIDCFAVSIGPGSFTGLRVGVSMLKGLNLVTKIPIVTVPTLDVIAYNAVGINTPICVIVDAKKKNLYSSFYKPEDGGIIRSWDYLLISAEDLVKRINGKTFFAGDGVALYGSLIAKRLKGANLAGKEYWSPDARVVARLGAERFKRGQFADPDTLVPMYIYSQKCNVRGIHR
jgi:tRNA threonylcarbamoyladenosine biosynthesis protein TsaB